MKNNYIIEKQSILTSKDIGTLTDIREKLLEYAKGESGSTGNDLQAWAARAQRKINNIKDC